MTLKKLSILFFALLFVFAVSGVSRAQKLHTLKIARGVSTITTVRVELANTPKERAIGLMYRKELAPDHGMLFMFQKDISQPFWMKNTYISLDIIFIDNNMEIVAIHRDAKPLSEELIHSKKPYRYVLEVNAEFADKHGLKLHDKIRMQTGI